MAANEEGETLHWQPARAESQLSETKGELRREEKGLLGAVVQQNTMKLNAQKLNEGSRWAREISEPMQKQSLDKLTRR